MFNITVPSKSTCSYWFVIIFFLLEKGLNICNYSACNCFIFFFWFRKISSICFVFRLLLYFYFPWFHSTINIFDTYCFTIIIGCVCFKKTRTKFFFILFLRTFSSFYPQPLEYCFSEYGLIFYLSIFVFIVRCLTDIVMDDINIFLKIENKS